MNAFPNSSQVLAVPPVSNLVRQVWPVGALLRAIADALEARFNPVTVEGEISGFSRASSGHCYFSLKDESGQMRCAMFRRAASLLNFTPADGQRVLVRGRVDVYGPRGELQLVVESIERAGQGDLLRQFLALKDKLEAEGLFDIRRKRPLPVMPRAIGVVTSLGAAALHDVVHALQRRVPHIPVVIYPATVQGAQAAGELCAALLRAYQRGEVDVLLLVRGGGSLEDLWSFNDEQLARTIVAAPMPIISGVGHETDFTIADFCADLRAPTPTAAAELCAQPTAVWSGALDLAFARLQGAVDRAVQTQAQRLDWASSRVSRPSHVVTRQQARLFSAAQALRQAASTRTLQQSSALQQRQASLLRLTLANKERHRSQLATAEIRLSVLNPNLVLSRGYAWLTDMQGQPLTRAAYFHRGQAVRAALMDGEVDLTVSAPRLI